jgi:hypothetical protein
MSARGRRLGVLKMKYGKERCCRRFIFALNFSIFGHQNPGSRTGPGSVMDPDPYPDLLKSQRIRNPVCYLLEKYL